MTDTNKTSGADVLAAALRDLLTRHRLQYWRDEDGDQLPLVDMLCAKGEKSISRGLDEIDLIIDAIVCDSPVAALIECNAELEAERDEALRRANRAEARVKGWESTMVVANLPSRVYPVDGWGPGEGETVEIPALTPEKLTEILDRADALAAEVKALRAILADAVDADGGTAYAHDEDEVGFRACCGVVSYEPHKADCWVARASAATGGGNG